MEHSSEKECLHFEYFSPVIFQNGVMLCRLFSEKRQISVEYESESFLHQCGRFTDPFNFSQQHLPKQQVMWY